jgi:hypothetical protein
VKTRLAARTGLRVFLSSRASSGDFLQHRCARARAVGAQSSPRSIGMPRVRMAQVKGNLDQKKKVVRFRTCARVSILRVEETLTIVSVLRGSGRLDRVH